MAIKSSYLYYTFHYIKFQTDILDLQAITASNLLALYTIIHYFWSQQIGVKHTTNLNKYKVVKRCNIDDLRPEEIYTWEVILPNITTRGCCGQCSSQHFPEHSDNVLE